MKSTTRFAASSWSIRSRVAAARGMAGVRQRGAHDTPRVLESIRPPIPVGRTDRRYLAAGVRVSKLARERDMLRKLLPIAVGLALSRAASAQTEPPANPANPPPPDPSIPVAYVGSNLRVSLGIDDSGDVLGEILGILGKTDDHAWLRKLLLRPGRGGGGAVR